MQRRIVWILLVTLLLINLQQAGVQSFIVGQFQEPVSATDVNSTIEMDGRHEVLLVNDGPNTVYVNLIGEEATTSHFPQKSGKHVSIHHRVGPELGRICATGEVASVRVLGVTYQLH